MNDFLLKVSHETKFPKNNKFVITSAHPKKLGLKKYFISLEKQCDFKDEKLIGQIQGK